MMMSVFPAIGFALCLACLLFYRIDLALENRLAAELAQRRLAYTAVPPGAPA
jgi:Na+/melibiose symporter-like transporter